MKKIFIILIGIFLTTSASATDYYVDFEGGNDGNAGTSFALRKKTIGSALTPAGAGDTIRVMATQAPVSIGSATWTNSSATVTLSSAKNKDIYLDGAWTCAANVTCTASTTRREGSNSASMAVASAFTTGKAAYYTLGASTDYSGDQQITLWFRTGTADSDISNNWQIKLCSDTTGDVAVDTLSFSPVLAGVANVWIPLKLNNGSALGSAIQSVALYVAVDPGAVTVLLDNISSTDDLWLGSLISKDTTGEDWYAMRSIVGTTILLDSGANSSAATTPRGYFGASESVTTYYREPVTITPSPTAATTDMVTIGESGSAGSPITISGGWNRTDMSTQTDETYYSAQNNSGEGFGIAGRTYINIDNIYWTHVDKAVSISGTSNNLNFDGVGAICVAGDGWLIAGTTTSSTFENIIGHQTATSGISMAGSALLNITNSRFNGNVTDGIEIGTSNKIYLENVTSTNNTQQAIDISSSNNGRIKTANLQYNSTTGAITLTNSTGWLVDGLTASNNAVTGLHFVGSPQNVFYNTTTSNNSAAADFDTNSSGENYFYNATFGEGTILASPVDYHNSTIISVNEDNTADNHFIYTDGGTISSESSVRHTASGISWELSPTSATRSSSYPLSQRIAGVYVEASTAYTATIWLRRTNTALTGTFRMVGGQIAGVSSDQTDSIGAVADTWEQQSISFTPTKAGIVDFFVEAYGGTTHSLFWDDFDISPATTVEQESGNIAYSRSGVYVSNADVSGGTTTNVIGLVQ